MRVLGRKAGERFILANLVTVTILSIEHDRVILSVDAPRYVGVVPAEMRDRARTAWHRKVKAALAQEATG